MKIELRVVDEEAGTNHTVVIDPLVAAKPQPKPRSHKKPYRPVWLKHMEKGVCRTLRSTRVI